MSKLLLTLVVTATLAGCSAPPVDSQDVGADAPAADAAHLDAGSDAGIDAGSDAGNDAGSDAGNDVGTDAATCPRTLLVGGTDVAAQGWSVAMQSPATITYGADYVELATSTTSGAITGGQLLLYLPGALVSGTPFRLQVEMRVVSVDPHNPFDSGAAILGSFTPPFGTSADRGEMIYLDAAAIGWADDTLSFATASTDGAFHVYELSVDAASVANVTLDGTAALTRTAFTTNGTIAIGDQTNEPRVDGTMQIRSVTLLCP